MGATERSSAQLNSLGVTRCETDGMGATEGRSRGEKKPQGALNGVLSMLFWQARWVLYEEP